MKVFLHIGTEKTGTTSIQFFLAKNRELLLQNGILVPESLGYTNHRKLPAIVCDDDTVDEFFLQQRLIDRAERVAAKSEWWKNFRAECATSGCDVVIISSEHLQSRLYTMPEVYALKALLGQIFNDIVICLYIRDPLETAISLYSTAIKTGSEASSPPLPTDPYFNNVVNHKATVLRWIEVFGADRLMLRLFETASFQGASLIEDFKSAAQLPVLPYIVPSRQNETLSALGLDLLREINVRLPMFSAENLENPMRGDIVSYFEKHLSEGSRFLPTSAFESAYSVEFSESNEWIRTNFFPDRLKLFTPKVSATTAPLFLQDKPYNMGAVADLLVELWTLKG